MRILVLEVGDEARLERFLSAHSDSSMFLRGNLHAAGLSYAGRRREAVYAAAVEGEEIVAVAAHAWNGILLFQAPSLGAEVARKALSASGRPLAGVSGPWDQVDTVRRALGLTAEPTTLSAPEVLYSLPLEELVLPRVLDGLKVRRAVPEDAALLSRWRHDYCVEALGDPPGEPVRVRAEQQIQEAIAARELFLAEEGGIPVATTAFNARVPEMVQVGAVFTPPAQRGRGYGRAVVAGQLRIARDEGARRAVLFTPETNLAARRAYESLGFRKTGAYGLVLFAQPVTPSR